MTRAQSHGPSHHNGKSCSSGQSRGQENMERMDLISSEPLISVVEETNQSQLARSTPYSSGYETKDTLTLTRVMPSEEEQSDNTTSLQMKEAECLKPLTNSSQNFKLGNQAELLEEAMKDSSLIRWFTYPFSMSLSIDDQAWFSEMLICRTRLVKQGYPQRFMLGWDIWQAIDLIRRYVLDSFSQLIHVNVNFPKK